MENILHKKGEKPSRGVVPNLYCSYFCSAVNTTNVSAPRLPTACCVAHLFAAEVLWTHQEHYYYRQHYILLLIDLKFFRNSIYKIF